MNKEVLLERVGLFDDTDEITDMLMELANRFKDEKDYHARYVVMETITHCHGLHELVHELAEVVKK